MNKLYFDVILAEYKMIFAGCYIIIKWAQHRAEDSERPRYACLDFWI